MMLVPKGTMDKIDCRLRAMMELYEFRISGENFIGPDDKVKNQYVIAAPGDPTVGIPSLWFTKTWDTVDELVEWANSDDAYDEFREYLVDIYGGGDVLREEQFLAERAGEHDINCWNPSPVEECPNCGGV